MTFVISYNTIYLGNRLGHGGLISHTPFAQVTARDTVGLLALRHLPVVNVVGTVGLLAIRLLPRHLFGTWWAYQPCAIHLSVCHCNVLALAVFLCTVQVCGSSIGLHQRTKHMFTWMLS
jgi:hypothetical protein